MDRDLLIEQIFWGKMLPRRHERDAFPPGENMSLRKIENWLITGALLLVLVLLILAAYAMKLSGE